MLKVKDEYRINPLSLKKGGVTVCVKQPNGSIREYDKVKNPTMFIAKIYKENPYVVKAWVKPNSLTK